MAGITDGVPEVAVGEPVRLGDNGEYELEHDPITDRLVVRDTVNSTEAYVRPETNDQIGNKGAFLRSLINSQPLADDGRLYDTIQEAERAANGWVFVPPGTFNERVDINTAGLELRGSGSGSLIDAGAGLAIDVRADNVSIRNLRIFSNTSGFGGVNVPSVEFSKTLVSGCVLNTGRTAISTGPKSTVVNNIIENANTSNDSFAPAITPGPENVVASNIIQQSNSRGIYMSPQNIVVANNIVENTSKGIIADGLDITIIGNRVHNSASAGIIISGSGDAVDTIVANNRISDSGDSDIADSGTNTTLDGNLTGASN